MFDFKGKVCLVTGAGGEIGGAIAEKLATLGGAIYFCDVQLPPAQERAKAISKDAHSAIALQLDVSSEESWANAINEVLARSGKLDVLVNCAGLFAKEPSSIHDIAFEEWRRLHTVNLDGAFLGVRAGVRAMREGGGAIVNIGSVVSFFGARSGVAYGVSKSATRGLTLQAAASCLFERIPVRVNAVHPGYVLTESALAGLMAIHKNREAAIAAFAARSPANRVIHPTDIANSVAFLASDTAKMINGAELLVDDGLSTQMPGKAFA
uniref:Short-chain dehydrogenase/reductase SDR n=1 Tax=Chelativorans sp. (strain BNC1) TaxID=266779 RepID=Q11FX9_CHESB